MSLAPRRLKRKLLKMFLLPKFVYRAEFDGFVMFTSKRHSERIDLKRNTIARRAKELSAYLALRRVLT